LQVGSLVALFLFFAAYTELCLGSDRQSRVALLGMIGGLAVVCAGSLILMLTDPAGAFDVTVAPPRYKGLLQKPGGMAAAASLLVGLCLFIGGGIALRAAGAVLGIANLLLTEARTSWTALVLAVTVTALLSKQARWRYLWALVVIGSGGIFFSEITYLDLSRSLGLAMRVESIGALSGRTEIWEMALEGLSARPLLGYGFTLGADVFIPLRDKLSGTWGDLSALHEGATLDSGYIQTLCDAGWLGFVLYLYLIVSTILRSVRLASHVGLFYPAFCVIYLSIVNFGENMIYSGATLPSIVFWYFAFMLRRDEALSRPAGGPAGAPESTGPPRAASRITSASVGVTRCVKK
jgi:O-antigen ligase